MIWLIFILISHLKVHYRTQVSSRNVWFGSSSQPMDIHPVSNIPIGWDILPLKQIKWMTLEELLQKCLMLLDMKIYTGVSAKTTVHLILNKNGLWKIINPFKSIYTVYCFTHEVMCRINLALEVWECLVQGIEGVLPKRWNA